MKNKGFTALELLIATSILTFIIAGMTIALQQQQRQFNLTRESVDVDQTARSVLEFITTEVRNSASRQGKGFSLKFIDGGSEPNATQRCDEFSQQSDFTATDSETGTVNSKPDCITTYTWDITRGQQGNDLPSVSVPATVRSATGSSLVLDLPSEWFDGTTFIGESTPGNTVTTLGFRSRNSICNSNSTIDCLQTPEQCSECAIIIEGNVDTGLKTFTIDDPADIITENFPVDFNSIAELINGKADPIFLRNYGFINNISSQSSEMSIVRSRTFRIDPNERALEMSENGGAFQTIAGGQQNTPGSLEAPGIVDLQLVFNLQNQDGTTTKVGFCDKLTSGSLDCNNITKQVFSHFDRTEVMGREQDIRSVEINLIVKSKTKPKTIQGGTFHQTIPAIGDVAERAAPDDPDATNPFNLKEPENGYIYRVYTNTVYVRNMSREDFG